MNAADAPIGYVGTFEEHEPLPDNWKKALGEHLIIAEFPELFKVFGTMYGGDGETTFGTPDFREKELDANMNVSRHTYSLTYKAFRVK